MVQVGEDEASAGAKGDRRRGEAGRNSRVGHRSALVCEAKQVVAPLPGVRIPAGAPTGGGGVAETLPEAQPGEGAKGLETRRGV